MEKIKYEDGVHLISNNDYHSSEGVSRSGLWALKKSPLHYWHQYLNPERQTREATNSMYLGSLVHTMVLEPELFEQEYIVKPDIQPLPPALKLKDVGREAFDANKIEREAASIANEMLLDEFNQRAEGKIVVAPEMMRQAQGMTVSVLNDDTAKNLINDSKIEHSIYFTHQPTGLQCKVRPDSWLGSIVTDLKTCADASARAFQSEAMRFGYYLQAGMINKALESIGIDMERFVFLCVEKTEPYPTATYVLDDEAIDYGVTLFDDLMVKYAECLEQDRWPAYPMQILNVPAYAKYDEVI